MTGSGGWQRVAGLSQLNDEEAFPVELGDVPIALYRLNGTVYAVDDVCTHEYALLSQGFVEECTIECPLHQAKFDFTTGRCLAGPAMADLKRYQVRIVGDDVYVSVAPSEP